MIKTKIFLWWALVAATLSACQKTPQPHQQTLYVFGTLVNITVYTDTPQQARRAFNHINQAFQAFHHRWHAWEPGGLVGKMNSAIAEGRSITVPEDMQAFILKSQALTRSSLGYFDPGIGALIDLWGFHGETFKGPPPSDDKIQQWLAKRPSILQLHVQGNQVISTNPEVKLDFGGNAKGLALDMAIEYMREAGIQSGIVNIGGDMKALGEKPNGQPWRIGVTNPFDKNSLLAEIDLHGGESLVTSGTYERFFTWKGQRFSHILNPNTGRPAKGIVSVTVLHPDAVTADAAATALLAAGPTHWQAVAAQMGIDTYAIVFATGKQILSPAMQTRWHPLNAASH